MTAPETINLFYTGNIWTNYVTDLSNTLSDNDNATSVYAESMLSLINGTDHHRPAEKWGTPKKEILKPLITQSISYLKQNYPNPFDNTTTIEYKLPENGNGELIITDILGRVVKKYNLSQREGAIVISQNLFRKGIYFYTLEVGNIRIDTKRMIIQ